MHATIFYLKTEDVFVKYGDIEAEKFFAKEKEAAELQAKS